MPDARTRSRTTSWDRMWLPPPPLADGRDVAEPPLPALPGVTPYLAKSIFGSRVLPAPVPPPWVRPFHVSKCRCGPVTLPVCPTVPIRSPALTVCPTRTSTVCRCPYSSEPPP